MASAVRPARRLSARTDFWEKPAGFSPTAWGPDLLSPPRASCTLPQLGRLRRPLGSVSTSSTQTLGRCRPQFARAGWTPTGSSLPADTSAVVSPRAASLADRDLVAGPALVDRVVATPRAGAVAVVDAGVELGPAVHRERRVAEVGVEAAVRDVERIDARAVELVAARGGQTGVLVSQAGGGSAHADLTAPTVDVARAVATAEAVARVAVVVEARLARQALVALGLARIAGWVGLRERAVERLDAKERAIAECPTRPRAARVALGVEQLDVDAALGRCGRIRREVGR